MTSFKGNYRGIGELLTSPEMQAAMLAKADQVKGTAVAIAPEETGDYKERFETSTGIHGGKTRRALAKVVNVDPASYWIEVGTHDTPRHRTLFKALTSGR